MMKVIALDIGGANTKITVLENGKIEGARRFCFYFPFWKKKNEFEKFLGNIFREFETNEIMGRDEIDGVGITMSAELCDAYRNKGEGVRDILRCVKRVLSGILPIVRSDTPGCDTPCFNTTCIDPAHLNTVHAVYVLSNDLKLIEISDAESDPYSVASANWLALAWFVANYCGNSLASAILFIDTGSTTTDIIPIRDGEIVAKGKSDLERLQNSELVYSGILRTNVATIVDSIPIRSSSVQSKQDSIYSSVTPMNTTLTKTGTGISSELFAITGDVYLILGDITLEDYVCETPDSRSKSTGDCMARLARVVCADMNLLPEKEIVDMAEYVKKHQMLRISDAIRAVAMREGIKKAVVTGSGRFLARAAAENAGLRVVKELDIDPSTALAVMVANRGA